LDRPAGSALLGSTSRGRRSEPHGSHALLRLDLLHVWQLWLLAHLCLARACSLPCFSWVGSVWPWLIFRGFLLFRGIEACTALQPWDMISLGLLWRPGGMCGWRTMQIPHAHPPARPTHAPIHPSLLSADAGCYIYIYRHQTLKMLNFNLGARNSSNMHIYKFPALFSIIVPTKVGIST